MFDLDQFIADCREALAEDQQFPETHKNQHSSGIPTCLFVNCHAKMGLS